MKTSLQLLGVLALAVALMGASSPKAAKRYLLKIKWSEYKAHYNEIRAAGIDIAGRNMQQGNVDLLVSIDETEQLRQMGIQVARNPMLVHNDAPDAKYKTPDQVAQILASYQSKYPELAQVKAIGKSLQGRDILAIRLTSHLDQPDPKKRVAL